MGNRPFGRQDRFFVGCFEVDSFFRKDGMTSILASLRPLGPGTWMEPVHRARALNGQPRRG